MSVGRAFRGLHGPLQSAYKNSFRLLDQIADLGPTLARAAEQLAEALTARGSTHASTIQDYAKQLEEFEGASRTERARLVALGLRLCAVVGNDLELHQRERQREEEPKRGERATTEVVDEWADLTVLKGVGPAVARRLAERGIRTVEDLLFFLPLEYQDRRTLTPLTELRAGERVTTGGVVRAARQRRARGRTMVEVSLAPTAEEPPLLWCVWFRAYPGLAQRFNNGETVVVHGAVQRYKNRLQITHPDLIEGDAGPGIRRRYPEVAGVAPRTVEKLCSAACQQFAGQVQAGLPEQIAGRQNLPGLPEALRQLHLVDFEPSHQELELLQRGDHPAQRSLVFDELFSLQLAVALRRARWDRRSALACSLSEATEQRMRACLPFSLTRAQERVVAEIRREMGRRRPMHRLLQGDVGSGKTAVAFAAACAAMDSGLQAAIMAPTDLLAKQHLSVLEPWVKRMGWRAALVTASTPRAARASLLALADAGEIHLLVGTHALLSPRVSLPNLGLAVVDEQHRFGVLQRIRLRDRSQDQPLPHLLLMTATPIPRSMALALYGDLDLSLLDELPPGRLPPRTEVYVGRKRRETAYGLVEQQLALGQQVFVVCPLVEESEKLSVADAVSTADQLSRRFPDRRVGLVHGRLPPRERDQQMAAFRARELDLLVATTVIEVGVDIPRANVMVVEHAERFGLAQLHQLRGRIGRGGEQSHCLLLSEAADPDSDASARLAVMARTTDGFEIAEADLSIRGPGELFGTQQSGIPRLRFVNLREQMQLLALAQQEAIALVEGDPELAEPEHRRALEVMQRRWEGVSLVGAEAG